MWAAYKLRFMFKENLFQIKHSYAEEILKKDFFYQCQENGLLVLK
jgi:hypothetical protein